jgi:hypothetical protein
MAPGVQTRSGRCETNGDVVATRDILEQHGRRRR